MAEWVIWSQPNRARFLVTEDKSERRETLKQAATESGCIKGPAEHHKGGNTGFGYIHGF